MNIAIVGGRSYWQRFCFSFGARGARRHASGTRRRLEALRREGAIVSVSGERAQVTVAEALDAAIPYDLVLVTVLAHQVDGLLDVLRASAGKTVMLMFNTFDSLERWRDAIGVDRFAVGFPNMLAFLVDGKLRSVVDGARHGDNALECTLGTRARASGFPHRSGGRHAELLAEPCGVLCSHFGGSLARLETPRWADLAGSI